MFVSGASSAHAATMANVREKVIVIFRLVHDMKVGAGYPYPPPLVSTRLTGNDGVFDACGTGGTTRKVYGGVGWESAGCPAILWEAVTIAGGLSPCKGICG
jgi:hypothetical protein